MSFNNAFIDLDKSGFTLISGENNCAEDNSKSQGSNCENYHCDHYLTLEPKED